MLKAYQIFGRLFLYLLMQKFYINVALILAGAIVLKKLLQKRTIKISGFYAVSTKTPNRLDALHSFESRKSDGFGGRMSTKVNAALAELAAKGIKPDIKEINIKIDPILYTVDWSVKIGASTDGKSYTGLITRGSAGTGADERAAKQLPELQNKKNAKLVKDLNFNENGVKIRQYFYKYTK
jgi:hypothetical protein